MKIATYNIWNKNVLFEERLTALCEVIDKINADIICLQEIRNDGNINIVEIIANYANYPFFIFREYPDCTDEGLAILSKFEFHDTMSIWETDTDISNYCAIRSTINYNGTFIGVTNVHLNWRSEEIRMSQLNAVNSWINMETNNKNYEIICGDFNDVPESNIHNFLIDSGWKDAVESTREKDIAHYSTFDLVNNPYLKDDIRVKDRLRFDWIMINKLDNDTEFNLKEVNIFGNKPLKSNIIPSDHYGLYIDIK